MAAQNEFQRVATVTEMTDGEMKLVTINNTEVCLARIGAQYFAMNNECTHAGAMLSLGPLDTENYQLQCPLHGSVFDVRTGNVVKGPADEPEQVYAVKIEGEDILVAL
jgi:nitrite reductase/ring-hydroxylating ferredoxin subunit